MHPISSALALVLLLTAPLSAQEAILLPFGWEPGLRATVTQTMDQSSNSAGMQVQQRTVIRHTIETAEHPEGLVIRFRDGAGARGGVRAARDLRGDAGERCRPTARR